MIDYIPNVKFLSLALVSLAVLECPHTVEEKKAILEEFLDTAFKEDIDLFRGVIDRINQVMVNHTRELKPFETAIIALLQDKYGVTIERGLNTMKLQYSLVSLP